MAKNLNVDITFVHFNDNVNWWDKNKPLIDFIHSNVDKGELKKEMSDRCLTNSLINHYTKAVKNFFDEQYAYKTLYTSVFFKRKLKKNFDEFMELLHSSLEEDKSVTTKRLNHDYERFHINSEAVYQNVKVEIVQLSEKSQKEFLRKIESYNSSPEVKSSKKTNQSFIVAVLAIVVAVIIAYIQLS